MPLRTGAYVPFDSNKIPKTLDESPYRAIVLPITRGKFTQPTLDPSSSESELKSESESDSAYKPKLKEVKCWQPSHNEASLELYARVHPYGTGEAVLFKLSYDVYSDNVVFRNVRRDLAWVASTSLKEQNHPPTLDAQNSRALRPNDELSLFPGSWQISLSPNLDFILRVVEHADGLSTNTKGLPTSSLSTGPPMVFPALTARSTRGSASRTKKEFALPPITHAIANAGLQSGSSVRASDTNAPSTPQDGDEILSDTYFSMVKRTRRNGNVVVAKALKQRSQPSIAASMWEREVFFLRELSHESIVKLLDVDAHTWTLYLSYEGSDLSMFVDKGGLCSLSDAEAETVYLDIAAAVKYVHEKDVVHGDIKPQNILFQPGIGAVLCDFGLASWKDDPSRGGTPHYLGDDYRAGRRGQPADVWAFGVSMLFAFGVMPLPKGRLYTIAKLETHENTLSAQREWMDTLETYIDAIPDSIRFLEKAFEAWGKRSTAAGLLELFTIYRRKALNLIVTSSKDVARKPVDKRRLKVGRA